jgi:hypothetical protein
MKVRRCALITFEGTNAVVERRTPSSPSGSYTAMFTSVSMIAAPAQTHGHSSMARNIRGLSERESLALAISLEEEVEASGLNVIGTLGTLVAAKRAGLLKSIRPELDALVRTSFSSACSSTTKSFRRPAKPIRNCLLS